MLRCPSLELRYVCEVCVCNVCEVWCGVSMNFVNLLREPFLSRDLLIPSSPRMVINFEAFVLVLSGHHISKQGGKMWCQP